jgi:hypothetical protein
MDGEGLFHGDLLFRVDRHVYAVLYHIYSCLSRNPCKYMQRESFRIEPPRKRGRLIASPTTNAILRRGGVSPPDLVGTGVLGCPKTKSPAVAEHFVLFCKVLHQICTQITPTLNAYSARQIGIGSIEKFFVFHYKVIV